MNIEFPLSQSSANLHLLDLSGASDDFELRHVTRMGTLNLSMRLNKKTAPNLALALLQLSPEDAGVDLAVKALQASFGRAAEAKQLDNDARRLFRAAYPTASWEDLGREIKMKFYSVAEDARRMYQEEV